MDFHDSSTVHYDFKQSGNLLSTRFHIAHDTPKGAINREAIVINYIITLNDDFLPSDDPRVEALMTSYASSKIWEALQYDVEMRYSSLHTFEAHISDKVINDSVVAKFDTNVVDHNAVTQLRYITISISHYTPDYHRSEFIKELNYIHYTFLLCHWEHQMPLVFSIAARNMFAINFKHIGSVSFSLTGSGSMMVKLLRIVDQSGESVSQELALLSKNSKKRENILKRLKNEDDIVIYPLQFFS